MPERYDRSTYNANRLVTLTGCVTKYSFRSPYIMVRLDAGTTRWLVEGPTPRQARRQGINEVIVFPGDLVTISGWPARDGSHKLMGHELTLANRATFTLFRTIE